MGSGSIHQGNGPGRRQTGRHPDIGDLRDGLKATVERAIAPLCRLLARRGVAPNQLTLAGLLLGLAAAALLAAGLPPWWAGLVFLAGSLFDLLDGGLARSSAREGRLGAFLDSVSDRLQEGAMLCAVAWRLALAAEPVGVAGAVLALTGSLLTSYVKARAEGLGSSCRGGWCCRPERVALITLGLLTAQLAPMVWVLALLSWLTTGQRIREVAGRLGP